MVRRSRSTLLFSLAVGLAISASAPVATARVEAGSDYTKAQTFSAALRYLRVDLGYDVLEKDPDAAYLLFKYPVPGRKDVQNQGSIEVVDAPGHVKVVVQLPQLPEYQERLLRDGLLHKLREEYGTPPPAPRPPPATDKKKPPAGDAKDSVPKQ